MKTIVWQLFLLLMVMSTLGVAEAKAQVQVQLKTSTPFVAGDATFPSGSYTIIQQQDDPQLFEITDNSNSHSALLSVEIIDSDRPRAKSEVIFNKYGNTLVMKQIWVSGSETGYLVTTGHVEKKAAKSGKPTKQSVETTSKQ
jgi:hypothetical protein